MNTLRSILLVLINILKSRIKLLLLIAAFTCPEYSGVKAQPNLRAAAHHYLTNGELDKAKQAIDKVCEHELTMNDAETWYLRSFIYKDVYTKKESADLYSPARIVSIESAKKAIDLDSERKYSDLCKELIKYLASSIFDDASNALNKGNYKFAIKSYEQYLEYIKIPEPDKQDASALFYVGYAALQDRQVNKAKGYLNRAINLNYDNPIAYLHLGNIYWSEKDIEKSLNILEKGYQRYPDNKEILITQVNYYVELNRIDSLEDKLKKAIELDPKNIELYLMLAQVYERISEVDDNKEQYLPKAKIIYKKAILLEPDNVRANYNLGILFYNEAVNLINRLDYDIDFIAISEIQDMCIELFKESLPYMEKAYKLAPDKKNTLIGLEGIYYGLGENEKSNEIRQKIDTIEKK